MEQSELIWEHLIRHNVSTDLVYIMKFPRVDGSVLDLETHYHNGVHLYTEKGAKRPVWIRMDKKYRYNDIVAAMKHSKLDFCYKSIKILPVVKVRTYKFDPDKFNYIVIADKHAGIAYEIYEETTKEKY